MKRPLRAGGVQAWLVLATAALIGCGFEAAPPSIPPGASQVRVTTSNTGVHLEPARVPAGEVFLIFEVDPVTQHVPVAFIYVGEPFDATPEPLSEQQIAEVRRTGSASGTSIQYGAAPVEQLTMVPGPYAFLLATEGEDGLTSAAGESLAILEVTP